MLFWVWSHHFRTFLGLLQTFFETKLEGPPTKLITGIHVDMSQKKSQVTHHRKIHWKHSKMSPKCPWKLNSTRKCTFCSPKWNSIFETSGWLISCKLASKFVRLLLSRVNKSTHTSCSMKHWTLKRVTLYFLCRVMFHSKSRTQLEMLLFYLCS